MTLNQFLCKWLPPYRWVENYLYKRSIRARLEEQIKVPVIIIDSDRSVYVGEASFYPDIEDNVHPGFEVRSDQDFLGWKSYSGCPANQATFDLETGRHITWGQGLFVVDQWPRINEASLWQVKHAVTLAKLSRKKL